MGFGPGDGYRLMVRGMARVALDAQRSTAAVDVSSRRNVLIDGEAVITSDDGVWTFAGEG
jgi:hypothetical protein